MQYKKQNYSPVDFLKSKMDLFFFFFGLFSSFLFFPILLDSAALPAGSPSNNLVFHMWRCIFLYQPEHKI